MVFVITVSHAAKIKSVNNLLELTDYVRNNTFTWIKELVLEYRREMTVFYAVQLKIPKQKKKSHSLTSFL